MTADGERVNRDPRPGSSGRSVRLEGEREKRRAAPEPVAGLVGSLLERWGIADKVERARAANEWELLVGPHIARVTRGVRVRGRALFVEVESAAWISELNMRRHDLLARINAGKTRGRIERIVFVQGDGEPSDDGWGRQGD